MVYYRKQKKMEMRRLVPKTTMSWYLRYWPMRLLRAFMNFMHRVIMVLLLFKEFTSAVLILQATANTVLA